MTLTTDPKATKGTVIFSVIIAVLTAIYEIPEIGKPIADFLDQHEAIVGVVVGILVILWRVFNPPQAKPAVK